MRLIPNFFRFGFTFICFNGFVSSKIYDKPVDFDFDMVNFVLFFFIFIGLDWNVPHSNSYGLYLSQLVHFIRVSLQQP